MALKFQYVSVNENASFVHLETGADKNGNTVCFPTIFRYKMKAKVNR